ncbi:MAG: universal stress protein [Desulfobacterales bacterium]|nr:MAG: universal stress protein [Desulfobacterales bacterium]
MQLPKIEVKKILYATDLSESARYAFAYALSLANLYRSKLVMLHVLPEDRDLDGLVSNYIDPDQWQKIKAQHLQDAREALIGKRREGEVIREVLGHFYQEAGKDLDTNSIDADEILVERGHPVEQIVRISEEQGIDLIVMGRHGYGALKDALMGGVARGVLRHSSKPVLLVKQPEEEE